MENNSTSTRSPLWRKTWPPESFNGWYSLLTAGGVVAFTFIPLLAFLMAGVALGAITPRSSSIAPSLLLVGQLTTYLPLGIYLMLTVPRLAHVPLRQLGFYPPGVREIAAGVAGTVLMYAAVDISAAVAAGLTGKHDSDDAVKIFRELRDPRMQLMFAALAVVLAPMIEEFAFRIFLYNALSRYTVIPVAAILSGLLFGLVHMTSLSQFPTVVLPLACGGVVLAYVYEISGCYWSNVMTHALFNAGNLLLILAYPNAT